MIARDIVLMPEWSIDLEPDAATLYDLSRYRNNGTITNATLTRLPSGLWYLDLDGTGDWIEWVTWNPLAAGEALSFEVWARFDRDGTLEAVFGLGDDSVDYNFLVCYRLASGALRFNVGNSALAAYTASFITTSTTLAPIDVWNHIVVTYDQAATPRTTIKVDGVNYVGADAGSGADRAKPTAYLLFGAMDNSHHNPLDGGLLPKRIYNYALTMGQARNHYEKTKHWLGVHD